LDANVVQVFRPLRPRFASMTMNSCYPLRRRRDADVSRRGYTCTGAVTPITTPGRAVTSGTTLTIAGEDFGTQCGSCKVYATPAGATSPTTLSVTSWTSTAISVELPASLTGYQTLQVNAVAGVDANRNRRLQSGRPHRCGRLIHEQPDNRSRSSTWNGCPTRFGSG
jgi:hypothetical protein